MMMMMESPSRYGVVAVFAVSGSIAFLVHHLQKRLLSDFMRKLEFQISGNSEKGQGKKKKVRFAEKVIEVAAEVKEEEKGRKLEDVMPPNRAALYRGIIKHRTFHAQLRF